MGRPRQWREEFVSKIQYSPEEFSFQNILKKKNEITGDELIRRGDILISLATGSINEAERLGLGVPDNILDQIKGKLFCLMENKQKIYF